MNLFILSNDWRTRPSVRGEELEDAVRAGGGGYVLKHTHYYKDRFGVSKPLLLRFDWSTANAKKNEKHCVENMSEPVVQPNSYKTNNFVQK